MSKKPKRDKICIGVTVKPSHNAMLLEWGIAMGLNKSEVVRWLIEQVAKCGLEKDGKLAWKLGGNYVDTTADTPR